MSAQQLASIVKEIVRDTGRPARTVAIAVHCNATDRCVRYWLRELEECGLIKRVGQRRGWVLPS